MWEKLPPNSLLENASEGPHRRTGVPVPLLQQKLFHTRKPAAAPADTHGGKALQVRDLRQKLQPDGHSEKPPADTYGRTALRLRDLRQKLHPKERLKDAPENLPLGGELAGVCGLWQRGGLRGLAPQTPADPRGGRTVHVRALWPETGLRH